jgi:paraquat-inducible protein B
MTQNDQSPSRDDETGNETIEPAVFPDADIRTRPTVRQQWTTIIRNYWWAIGGAIALACVLVASSASNRGTRITIAFDRGHGIKPGDAVRYRGIEVGNVEVVQLQRDGSGVRLDVRLATEGQHLAREGSRFWIERPQVSLSRIQGLDTVIGAKYVGVLPGPTDDRKKTVFRGSETPIWLDNAEDGELEIEFADGQGLEVGDSLRYRGIEIGEVMAIALDDALQSVRVHVQLNAAGSPVARLGSQFWIQHPAVSFSGVRGLDTIVGGRYVAVIPGPPEAASQRRFVGLSEPPAAYDRPDDGLEIRLTSSHRSALRQRVRITYRGLPIGRVLSTGLAADAVSVEARVYILPEYKHLVRRGSVFWNAGGVRFRAGVSGLDLRIDSLESVVQGSIAMATPEDIGESVATGHTFEFYDEADEKWLAWNPRIPLGNAMTSNSVRRYFPTRYRLSWTTRRLGFRKQRGVSAWAVRHDGNKLLTLSDVLENPAEHLKDSILELDGQEYPLAELKVEHRGPLAVLNLGPTEISTTIGPTWPADLLRPPVRLEDCLIITNPTSRAIPVAVSRLRESDGVWIIDPSLSFDEIEWQSAAVIATSDQKLIGLLRVVNQTGEIVPYKE